MKTFLFIVAFLSIGAKVLGQNSIRYNNFLEFVRKGFNPSDSIKQSCEWQYALVELHVNTRNKITSYNLLNKSSNGLKSSFDFLIGYRFSDKIPINKHPIVFCISIDSEKSKCKLIRMAYSPTEVLGIFSADLVPLFNKDPKTIFIPNILQVGYSFDGIR